jgi:hypothetical protein
VFVTRHSTVEDRAVADRLWLLYEDAYRRVADESPSHEMLFRSEFDDSLADPTNRLWVVWDDTEPVAMALVATRPERTRYLSRAYFDAHFPEHAHRETVHYIMWLVVHPAAEARGAIVQLSREALRREAADGALLVFDAPMIHQPGDTGGFAEMMQRLVKSFVGAAPMHHLGTQRYYAVDFASVADPAEPAEPGDRGQVPLRSPIR